MFSKVICLLHMEYNIFVNLHKLKYKHGQKHKIVDPSSDGI